MGSAVIVGDGPGGLSAALFLAKRGLNVTVFGQDRTPMHKAVLYNYLGIPEVTGSEFQRVSREQVAKLGAVLQDIEVTAAEKTNAGFAVTDESGKRTEGKYLILATGRATELAVQLGLPTEERGNVNADREGRTAVPGLFVIGWTTRPHKIQAIISAGDGAAAALAILSDEAGKDVHDFDVVS